MRFFYADPGLHSLTGHHPNVCRSVQDELAARAIPTAVLAFAGVQPALREELSAIPFFRYNQYWAPDDGRLPGALEAFKAGAQTTREDLHRISDIQPDDLVFVPWALPAQVLGALLWMSDLPANRIPRVIVNFLDIRDLALETSATEMLRSAAKHLSPTVAARLTLGCTFPEGVAVAHSVLGLPVEQLPAPQHALAGVRRRSAAGPIAIGMAGHQQSAKGVHHMPDLVRGLLQLHPSARVLVHDSSGDLRSDVADQLSRIEATDRRLTMCRKALDREGWGELLDRIDLLLCPYDRHIYRLCSSGVQNEAIDVGIPSVVPSGTPLATQARAFGDGGMTFGPGEPGSVIDAVRRALDRFDHYAGAAHQGALLWQQINGPDKLVERLLSERP